MTPIQTHEAELRTLMERAGLVTQEPSERYLDGHSDTATVSVHLYRGGTIAFTVDAPHYSAEHPDPRIALRHCLEMAGLLTDRPPQTDEQLIAWLTERAGPADSMNRWSHNDYIIRQLDHAWAYWHQGRPLQRSAYARELGAILWTAERFPEVNP